MNKRLFSHCRIKSHQLLVFLGMLMVTYQAYGQHVLVQYCSGMPGGTQSTTYGPMYSTATANSTNRMAVILPSSQLAGVAGKTLTDIYFHRGSATAMLGTPNFKVYLKEVAATDWGASAITWATEIAGATLVFDGNPIPYVGTSDGWRNFPFGTNFPYSGTQNLAVFLEYTNPVASNAVNWSYDYTSPCVNTSNSNTTKYSNVTTGVLPTSLASTNYRRPYMAFDTLLPPCVGTPNPGTASATHLICAGNSVNLSLSGYTAASGLGIQWEFYNGSAWAPIAGATGDVYVVPSVSATTQYRAVVSCGAANATSNTTTAHMVPSFAGGTYTLNSALATGGSNFQTIAALDSALFCGLSGPLTINVNASGTYSGQLHLKNIGSSTNTITINGNGATITYNPTADMDRACIRLDNADYVTINNLNVTLAPGAIYGYGIQLTNDADYATINGCTILGDMSATSTNFGGIIASGAYNGPTTAGSNCNNLTITNNTIAGGYYSITLVGTTTTGINEDNVITNNTIRDFYLYGIYSTYNNNMIIRNNDFHRLNRLAISTFAPVYLTTGTTKATVDRNKIHDAAAANPSASYTAYGVYNGGSTGSAGNETVISNNIIYNLNGLGTHHGFYNSASTYIRYLYNTYSSDDASSASGLDYGLYFTGAAANCEFRNNMISITRGGTDNKFGQYMNSTTSVIPVSNNNNYYINSATAGTNHIGRTNAAGNLTTMTNWQTTSSQDANSVTVNPMFASTVTGNLRPTAPAGLDNLGAPIAGITIDITGATRNATTPDIGAFEWTPPVCVQPTGLNATAVTSTGATLGWTAVAGATGYEWMVTTSSTPPATGTPIGAVTTVPSGTLTPSTFYYFHIRANCGANGYSYWSTLPFTSRPVNDDCANSINISNSLPTVGSTIGGTQTQAPCATTSTTLLANDVWYHFTTTSVGDVTVTATNTAGDVALEVFSGTCGSGTSLACVDGPAIGTELITLPALAPGTYYVRVYGYLSSQTGFTVQVLINGFPLSTNEVNISAVNKGSYNQVNWNITSDVKYTSFDLERSGDGERFTQIATVAANEGNEYAYNDNKPLTGMNYYRIKTADRSGKASYSKVVFTSVKDADVFTAEAYPNPVQDKFTVKVYGNQGSNAQIVVTDIAGKLMRQVSVTGNETIIDMSGMDQGIYFVKYQDNVHSEVMKITKQ